MHFELKNWSARSFDLMLITCSFNHDMLKMRKYFSSFVTRHQISFVWVSRLNLSWIMWVMLSIDLLSIKRSLIDLRSSIVENLCFLTKLIFTKLFAKISMSIRISTLTAFACTWALIMKFNCRSLTSWVKSMWLKVNLTFASETSFSTLKALSCSYSRFTILLRTKIFWCSWSNLCSKTRRFSSSSFNCQNSRRSSSCHSSPHSLSELN